MQRGEAASRTGTIPHLSYFRNIFGNIALRLKKTVLQPFRAAGLKNPGVSRTGQYLTRKSPSGLMAKYTSLDAPGSVPCPSPLPLPPGVAVLYGPRWQAGTSTKLRSDSDAYAKSLVSKRAKLPVLDPPKVGKPIVHTPRLKTDPPAGAGGFSKSRASCRKTHDFLEKRAFDSLHSQVTILAEVDPLYRAAKKIQNCALNSAYRMISPTVNYKVGTALCKNRLCPNCQRLLSAKRKGNALNFFELNEKQLRKYGFFHIVLPVRHSAEEGVRTGLYAAQLLGYYTELRGMRDGSGAQLRARDWWNSYVAGGFYSMEIAFSSADGTPHIHLHILAISHRKLYNRRQTSVFKEGLTERWREVTGDSYVTHVEPVYYKDPVTGAKIHCPWGHSANLGLAIAETMKYTLKSDVQSLSAFSDGFLRELLTMRNRYFSRFGILTKKHPLSGQFTDLDMLNTDYKDLESLSRLQLDRLLNPETGDMVPESETMLIVTPQRNMVARPGAVVQVASDSLLFEGIPLAAEISSVARFTDTSPGGRAALAVYTPLQRATQSVGGLVCYEIIDAAKFVLYRGDDRAAVARHLASTIRNSHDAETDDLEPDVADSSESDSSTVPVAAIPPPDWAKFHNKEITPFIWPV